MARRSDAEVQEIQRLYQDRIASVLQGEVLPNEIEFSNEQQPGWQPLSSAQLLVLIHKLSTCSNVRKFSLEGCHFGNGGAIAFASSLRGHLDLQHVKLNYCDFGDEGAVVMESLKGHPALQHLELMECGLKNAEATSLALSIEGLSALQHLTLSECPFGDEAAIALARSLRGCPALQFISITYCFHFGEAGAAAFAEFFTFLRDQSALQQVEIYGCDFRNQGAMALRRSLLGHTALRTNRILIHRNPHYDIIEDDNIIGIVIDRSNILQSSLSAFFGRSDDEFNNAVIKVTFDGEDGQDAGGLFREWMTLIAPKLFCWPLFLNVLRSDGTLSPVLRLNPIPTLNFVDDRDACHQHLWLLGLVLGFSVRKHIPLGVDLTPAFCKLLLQQEPCFADLEHEMPDKFQQINLIIQQMDGSSPSSRQAVANDWFNSDDPMAFDTPSRSRQIKDFIEALRQINPHAPAALQQPQVGDEPTSALAISTGTPSRVSGENFSDFVIATVLKQMSSNLQVEAMPHILPAFKAAAGTSTNGMSYEELQNAIEGVKNPQEFIRKWQSYCNPRELLCVKTSGAITLPMTLPPPVADADPQFYHIDWDDHPDHLPFTHNCMGLGQITLPNAPSKEELKRRLYLAIEQATYGFA